ncbi:MAG: ParB N-terminal domain-containing protein [Pirellulaceae bacterium]|nr:ParB N-terminal domain-containing protein [Pirellulaceae bacterium]
MTPTELILSKLSDARRTGKSWSARCPAHDDRRASLSVSEGDNGKINQDRILTVPLSSIHPAPENLDLYRPVREDDPEVMAMADSIRQHGIREPLVISSDGFLLSGHRRHVAARLAGLTELRCRIDPVSRQHDPEQFLELLREHNRQRVKSREEMLRETIIDAKPEDAYRQLTAYRTRKPRQPGGKAVKIIGTKTRAKITAAKSPLLSAVKKIISSLEDVWPVTVRQVHYQLLNDPPLRHASKPDSMYQNDKHSYQSLVDLLSRARLAGIIPWDAITDETRPVVTWKVYPSVQPYLRDQLDKFLRTYWRDLMQSQPDHIEIVGEKGTLMGTLRPIAAKFCLPLTLGRGYCSLHPRHEMAERYSASGKNRLVVLILSDFDPEGEDIAHSFARSMRDDFGVGKIDARKVALTAEQVEKYHLPPIMEAKTKSARYDGFVKRYGTTVHELESLPPKTLQNLLDKAIRSTIDLKAFDQEQREEQKDAVFLDRQRQVVRSVMADIANNYGGDHE